MRSRFKRVARRVTTVLGAGAVVGSAGLAHAPSARAAMPLQRGWESCKQLAAHLDVCEARLDRIKAAGFGVVVASMLPEDVDPDLIDAYAHAAGRRGLKLVWTLSNPLWWNSPPESGELLQVHTQLAAACGCTTNAQLLDFTVRRLSATGVSYGYYIADDSQAAGVDVYGAVARFSARIRAIDPTQRTIMGTWGLSSTDMFTRAAAALDTPAQEVYAVSGPLSAVTPASTDRVHQTVSAAAAAVQTVMDRAGRSSAFIMQGFSTGDHLVDAQGAGLCPPERKHGLAAG